MVFDGEGLTVSAYGVLKLNKWSSYLSFAKAEKKWMGVKFDGQTLALVRRYGTIGIQNKNGITIFSASGATSGNGASALAASGLASGYASMLEICSIA